MKWAFFYLGSVLEALNTTIFYSSILKLISHPFSNIKGIKKDEISEEGNPSIFFLGYIWMMEGNLLKINHQYEGWRKNKFNLFVYDIKINFIEMQFERQKEKVKVFEARTILSITTVSFPFWVQSTLRDFLYFHIHHFPFLKYSLQWMNEWKENRINLL